MSRLYDWLEAQITRWAPTQRRRAAIKLFVWSLVAMVGNVAAYAVGWIGESILILVTLVLSWLAITLTAIDIVATTDVREEST